MQVEIRGQRVELGVDGSAICALICYLGYIVGA